MPPDKNEFLSLVQDNRKIIFKICNSYCPNRSERDDLAQEIVYQLWKSFPGYNAKAKFSTWMYRIALNVAISYYRKDKTAKNIVLYNEQLLEIEDSIDDDATIEERKFSELQKFIGELKAIDRSIMMLYLEEKTYKEIAEIIGISETNVATKISRIKDKLKTSFSHHTY